MPQEAVDWEFPNAATPPGSGVYYAVRFAPIHLRTQYAMLLAWYRKIRTIARAPADPGVARLKLDWWRTELGRTFNERQPRHPLTTALTDQQVSEDVVEPMHQLIDATESAIRQPVLDDVDDFRADCVATGGRLFEAFCRLEPASTYNTETAIEFGAYWEAVERLCRLPEWPQQVTALLDPQQQAKLESLARRRHCEALVRLPSRGVPLHRAPVPELTRRLVAVAQGLHRQLERNGFAATPRPVDRAPLAHLWTAWRCRGVY